MARPKNVAKTRSLTLAVTPELHRLLELLAETGLSAKNPAEIGEELLRRGLENFDGGSFFREAMAKRQKEVLG